MKSTAGFTMIELLVVLAIVLVLSVLGTGIGLHLMENSRATKCIGNLRGLGVALQQYLADHNQQMPTMAAARADKSEDIAALDTVLSAYTDDPRIFACPSDPDVAATTGTSYYWNSALNGQAIASLNLFQMIDQLSRIPVFSDKEGWHRYSEERVNVLYADGGAGRSLRFITE